MRVVGRSASWCEPCPRAPHCVLAPASGRARHRRMGSPSLLVVLGLTYRLHPSPMTGQSGLLFPMRQSIPQGRDWKKVVNDGQAIGPPYNGTPHGPYRCRCEAARRTRTRTAAGRMVHTTGTAATARPTVTVVMPPTASRPHLVDLLLCGHHFRVSQAALRGRRCCRLRRDRAVDHGGHHGRRRAGTKADRLVGTTPALQA